jgi:hypothetical protein
MGVSRFRTAMGGSGIPLRISLQEMLLAWAMTGVDPNEDPLAADVFLGGPLRV